jgi:S-adenosylmethionine synthetase
MKRFFKGITMYLWTSEAVSAGHPDKVADQIADSILDAYIAIEPSCRVAIEVTCCKDLVLITGEVSSTQKVDVEGLARKKIIEIGYDSPEKGYDGNTVKILNHLNTQSSQIANAVAKEDGEIGAGDQGLMFGYACDETPVLMPLAHHLSFVAIDALKKDKEYNNLLLPDAKSQVTIAYHDNGIPNYIDTVLVSTQHREKAFSNQKELNDYLGHIIQNSIAENFSHLISDKTKWLFNPAGLWTLGGPAADTGLSGRKIVVDNYGADCPIGGGSFSGKDPTKVDRSGAYASRHIAKNIVSKNYAKKCQVQVSYAIGVVEPVSIRVQTFGTGNDIELTKIIQQKVSLSPKSIIERLNLRTPIYANTASGGHFGRTIFPWEQINLPI